MLQAPLHVACSPSAPHRRPTKRQPLPASPATTLAVVCWLIAAAIITINASTAYETLAPLVHSALWLHTGAASLLGLRAWRCSAAAALQPHSWAVGCRTVLTRAAEALPRAALAQLVCALAAPRPPPPALLPARPAAVFWGVVTVYVGFLVYLILVSWGKVQFVWAGTCLRSAAPPPCAWAP